jgi:hypothetical protein
MSWSTATLVQGGQTYVDRLSGVERWGDYTGIARRHNSQDPRTWSSGSVGANISGVLDHTYKTWIGEVTNGQMVGVEETEFAVSFSVSPNPVRDVVDISFTITETIPVTIALHDMQGKLVRILYDDTPLIGNHSFSFQMSDVVAGVYLVSVTSTKGRMVYKRVVVE